jgi:hypothetical protein
MERQRRRPPRGEGPVMKEEDFYSAPDYGRFHGGKLQPAPNYGTRGDMPTRTMEMNREEHDSYMDMPEWLRTRRLRLAKGGAVKQYAEGGEVDKNFIQKAIKKPGALRKQMGVKAGQTIPKAKLAKAAKAPGKLGQRARFAQTLSKMGNK